MSTEKKKRVTGIGGVFFKCEDPSKVRSWYADHLGLEVDEYGTSFEWLQLDGKKKGQTAWNPFPKTTKYFGDSGQQYMVNYRVEDLEGLVAQLKAEGVTVVDEIQTFDYGKFVHILDPEGIMIELWEPFDEAYDEMIEARTS